MERLCLAPVDLASLAREIGRAGGALEVEVHGHSMWPLIADGERVVLGPLGPDGPSAGDVLLLAQDGRTFLHRGLGQAAGPRGPWLLCAGDAERGPPERFEPAAALARVVEIRRGPRVLLHPRRLLWLLFTQLLRLRPCPPRGR